MNINNKRYRNYQIHPKVDQSRANCLVNFSGSIQRQIMTRRGNEDCSKILLAIYLFSFCGLDLVRYCSDPLTNP